jgi:hypothetical protein
MSTAINDQVNAFGASVDDVMAAHQEATEWQNTQELVIMGTCVANGTTKIIDILRSRNTNRVVQGIPEWSNLSEALKTLLLAMNRTLDFVSDLQLRNCPIENLQEFREAMVEAREAWALVRDTQQPEADFLAAKKKVDSLNHEELRKIAAESPPPQSWFEEDSRKLRGKNCS